MKRSSENKPLKGMFDVRTAPRSFRRAVPRRIPWIRPFKDVSIEDANWMKVHAYNYADLELYNPCWTGEMASRPIPFVSTDSRPLKTQQVFSKYIRSILDYLVPTIVPGIQTINKVSSLGYPISANPGNGVDKKEGSPTFGQKIYQSKFDVTLDCFKTMQSGDFAIYADGYHTIGVRKQNEPPTKVREFQFITSKGEIYQRQITDIEREITVPELGQMVGSRTRTIVRPPVVNLWLQCWDTMLHNAIKKHPLFDSNVYVHTKWPSDANFVTFDCKHYERYMGLCAISYAEAIGGIYGEQLMQLIKYPFIVPSDDWTAFFEIRPLYREGVYPQFSSGLSPVAPLGKLTNICVQVAYFHEVRKLSILAAISTVLSGVSGTMRRWSFGDDNRILGEEAEVTEFCDFMKEYFDIEFDEPKRYLGTVFRPDLGQWLLPKDTYNLKLYQPERDYEWKDFPHLGMVARRETFTEFGEPEIARYIIPYEDELWTAVGHPFVEVAAAAVAERQVAMRKGIKLSDYLVTDKDYLMTEQQKMDSGLFWHLDPAVTATIVLSLVGNDIKEGLTFRAAHFTPVPSADKTQLSYTQNPFAPDSEEETYETTAQST